jgi:hypothetical protein
MRPAPTGLVWYRFNKNALPIVKELQVLRVACSEPIVCAYFNKEALIVTNYVYQFGIEIIQSKKLVSQQLASKSVSHKQAQNGRQEHELYRYRNKTLKRTDHA